MRSQAITEHNLNGDSMKYIYVKSKEMPKKINVICSITPITEML